MQNWSVGRKIKLGCSIMSFGIALWLLLVMVLINNAGNDIPGGIIVALILFIALGGYLIWDAIKGKDRLSAYQYNQFKEIRAFTVLNEKRNDYEKDLVNNGELFKYRELSKQYPSLYYNYASSVLNMPMQYSKPVSATTAAFVGTRIGGVAVGIAAANEAEKKRAAYEQNVKDVIASKLAVGSAHDKLLYCYDEMIKIIKTNDKTRKDWEYRESMIDSELHEKYKVR